MQIQNNIMAKNTSRNQNMVRGELKKSLEKLSSGYCINRAGDNAAGLAITESMRSQINGLDQAMRNINDGISMTNTGEGALQEVHSMLHRMKTLAIQSANGTYDTVARANIDAERLQLMAEIDRIGASSDFSGIPLFESDTTSLPATPPPNVKDKITLQIGHSAAETLDVDQYYMGSKALWLDKKDFSTRANANAAVDIIDDAIQAVTTIRSSFGAAQNHLQHTYNNLGVTRENMTAYESGIRDTDVMKEFTNFTSKNIISQAANSILSQANSVPNTVLELLKQ